MLSLVSLSVKESRDVRILWFIPRFMRVKRLGKNRLEEKRSIFKFNGDPDRGAGRNPGEEAFANFFGRDGDPFLLAKADPGAV